MALLGAFAGTIVDRTSIKRLMIGADLFIAAVSLTLVFGSLRGDLSVAVVAAVLFVRALGSTLHTPAFNALTPLIAPPEVLGKLAGMLQFMQSGSYIIGNAIAAAVYPAFGLTFMIALDVAGAVLASIAVATSGIKTPAPERHTPEENAEASHRAVRAFLLETANGYRELKRHHGLFAMLWIGFAFSVLFSPISALFPLMVFDHFGGTTTQSAIAEIAFSVGMIAASGWIGRRVALRTARFRARWPSASSERARSRAASCPFRARCVSGAYVRDGGLESAVQRAADGAHAGARRSRVHGPRLRPVRSGLQLGHARGARRIDLVRGRHRRKRVFRAHRCCNGDPSRHHLGDPEHPQDWVALWRSAFRFGRLVGSLRREGWSTVRLRGRRRPPFCLIRLARRRSSSVRRAIAMPPLADTRLLTLCASHRSGSVSCS